MPGNWRREARRVGYGMIGQRAGGIVVDAYKARGDDHTVPYGTDRVCPCPGISCLATFVWSLRDKTYILSPPKT